MIDINSYGGRIGKIQWCNTWHELWGSAGFWDKNPGEKGHFTLWGIRPKPIGHQLRENLLSQNTKTINQ